MKTSSPLRYPGGKSSLSSLLHHIRRLNDCENRAVAEPFAGGAGASLSLLFAGHAPKILINDADRAIHDFWWSLLNHTRSFQNLILRKRVSISEWRRQRDTYRSNRASRLRLGFSAFYLNRCNRSGIIMNGGPIGGIQQTGHWKLGARYNKIDLIRRCQKIAEHKDRIRISADDGIKFIKVSRSKSNFFFIDPPYFNKGKTLYLDALDEEYHAALAAQLKSMEHAAWVLTYDDCNEIRQMYQGWARIRPFRLRYVAAKRQRGKEILITPGWMKLPAEQESMAIDW